MVLADMLNEYYEKRRARRRTEDEARGAAQMNRKWSAWNQRRMDAEARGEDFDELPPGSSDMNDAPGVK